MSVGLLMLIVLAVIVAVVGVGVYASNGEARALNAKARIMEAKVETLADRQRLKIATNALRSIHNGAGNPVLEAQIALDEIDNTYTKELTR